MKRIILVFALVALLVAGVYGGIAFAGGKPTIENKLVGWGTVGTLEPEWGVIQFEARFGITNPNTMYDISIVRVRIYSEDGTKVYEGPFLKYFDDNVIIDPPIVVTTFGPHRFEPVRLSLWSGITSGTYTFEVFWTGAHKSLPLRGIALQSQTDTYDSGEVTSSNNSVPMENMRE